jgi:hypothetical protein
MTEIDFETRWIAYNEIAYQLFPVEEMPEGALPFFLEGATSDLLGDFSGLTNEEIEACLSPLWEVR